MKREHEFKFKTSIDFEMVGLVMTMLFFLVITGWPFMQCVIWLVNSLLLGVQLTDAQIARGVTTGVLYAFYTLSAVASLTILIIMLVGFSGLMRDKAKRDKAIK